LSGYKIHSRTEDFILRVCQEKDIDVPRKIVATFVKMKIGARMRRSNIEGQSEKSELTSRDYSKIAHFKL